MTMKTIHPVAAVRMGWKKFMERPWYFFGLSLATLALFVVTSGNGSAGYTALSAIAYGGFIALCLRHYDGHHVVFDDMFTLDGRWISFAFVMIIKGFGILLGFLLLIVPGIYLAIRWGFAEYLVIDRGMRPIEALRESSRLTDGIKWRLFGFLCLSMLVMLLGVLALGVGAAAAAVVLIFASIHLYRDLSQQ